MVNRNALLQRIFRSIAPSRCLLCNRAFQHSSVLCQDCYGDLPTIQDPCPRCAMPAPFDLCGNCIWRPPRFDRATAPFAYHYPIADLIREMKYQRRLPITQLLARALAQAVVESGASLPECIVPVPLHRTRLHRRGFNQSLEIARGVAQALNIPLNYRLIKKVRATQPQSELTTAERQTNIKGAFTLTQPLHYRTIAIVDDVITTGATLNELTGLLKKEGVVAVQAWAAARTV